MLELLARQIDKTKSREDNIFLVKEFLQLLILKIIDEAGFFKILVFTGGTTLRVLYDLQRFSEDLDFSQTEGNFDIEKLAEKLNYHLAELNQLKVSMKINASQVVKSIDVKFPELLYKFDLSSHPNQNIFIKIEIDSNPPKGGNTDLSINNRFFFLTIKHYDLPSLFATKLHACFYRKYTKGRDIYDLIWYLSKKVEPNLTLLNNAIYQTEKNEFKIDQQNLNKFLIDRVKNIDFEQSKKDVERFLFNKSELKLFNSDLIIKMIEDNYNN